MNDKSKFKFRKEKLTFPKHNRNRFNKPYVANGYEFRNCEGTYTGISQLDEARWIENRTCEKDPPNMYGMLNG